MQVLWNHFAAPFIFYIVEEQATDLEDIKDPGGHSPSGHANAELFFIFISMQQNPPKKRSSIYTGLNRVFFNPFSKELQFFFRTGNSAADQIPRRSAGPAENSAGCSTATCWTFYPTSSKNRPPSSSVSASHWKVSSFSASMAYFICLPASINPSVYER